MIRDLVITTLFIILFSSCTSSVNESDKFDQEQVIQQNPKYASCFAISDYTTFKVLTVYKKKGTKPYLNYIIYHRGSQKPKISLENSIIIETPIRSVACLSSVYLGSLSKLGLLETIRAVDNKNYISNPIISKSIKENRIKEIAIDGNINEEMALVIKPDLILTYGTGITENDKNSKLYKQGIPQVVCFDQFENSPLGRAEWIKFVACFFEKEEEANEVFELTEKKYLELKRLCDTIPNRPSVFTELNLADAWFVPGGKSYMAELLKDAGANYIWANDSLTGSLPLSFETVYSKAVNADFWLNQLFFKNREELVKSDERYAKFKAFQKNNLFNNNARQNETGANDFWESGICSPDEVLADLIKIFHPLLLPSHQLKYYQQLN